MHRFFFGPHKDTDARRSSLFPSGFDERPAARSKCPALKSAQKNAIPLPHCFLIPRPQPRSLRRSMRPAWPSDSAPRGGGGRVAARSRSRIAGAAPVAIGPLDRAVNGGVAGRGAGGGGVGDQAALDMVWSALSRGKGRLTPGQMSVRLKRMALGEKEGQ